jgi:hypothetical protein
MLYCRLVNRCFFTSEAAAVAHAEGSWLLFPSLAKGWFASTEIACRRI